MRAKCVLLTFDPEAQGHNIFLYDIDVGNLLDIH